MQISFPKLFFGLIVFFLLIKCDDKEKTSPGPILQLSTIRVGNYPLDLNDFENNTTAPIDKPILATFSSPLDLSSVPPSVTLKESETGEILALTFSFLDNNKTFSAVPDHNLIANKKYIMSIGSQIQGSKGERFPGIDVEFSTSPGSLDIISFEINGTDELQNNSVTNVAIADVQINITFSAPVDESTVTEDYFKLTGNGISVPLTISLAEENRQVNIVTNENLKPFLKYQLWISDAVKGEDEEVMSQFVKFFYTGPPSEPLFPILTDNELLTKVQQQTFKYFWDFAQPNSGMARERNTSGDLVTSGGSGFGIMSLIVGIERGFITRQEGLDRMDKILDFLETADRFHGAWSHWINGNSGNVIPFSENDNGGDLVETSFLVQGLLTFRQYLNNAVPTESNFIDRINLLWESVEWNWYTRDGQDVLYWHWSPDKAWAMNHQIRGYNECLITYILAASSSTHPIESTVYTNGWTQNGLIKNGNTYYGIVLPLGTPYGGPLFFAHYSFLGLDPRNLNDGSTSYWTQNVNHTLINQSYCSDNPRNFVGYSEDCWGLTASDNQNGYSAHSPTNDLGVITPTAALSSFPYAPEESMKALKFFYYSLGDRLWGEYGFYDAFNITDGWTANSYLAIDQGPIIIMIENYRTGLLWNLFMSAPEVQNGLSNLGLQ